MISNEADYKRYEIGKALKDHPERHTLTLKICGDEGATRWLVVTPSQVRAIRELLTDGDWEAIRSAAAGEMDPEPS